MIHDFKDLKYSKNNIFNIPLLDTLGTIVLIYKPKQKSSFC